MAIYLFGIHVHRKLPKKKVRENMKAVKNYPRVTYGVNWALTTDIFLEIA